MLEILYQDEYIVAINKPCGLLVHRTNIAEEENDFALDMLRAQLGCEVFLLHRLDRPTSGILLFAFTKEMAATMGNVFAEREIKKKYVALVRGWMNEEIHLNHPVKNEDKTKEFEAQTNFFPLKNLELPYPVRPYQTARYTLVECHPQHGRWHQIRLHLAHLRHYIVNDRTHGDGHHNRLFTDTLNIPYLFLHAKEISFRHPVTKKEILIEAPFPSHWQQFL